jgi:hypothetical protein
MPEKAIGSPAEAGNDPPPHDVAPRPEDAVTRARNTPRQDDGVTNPRDGRGPLRRRDDQAAKLPLHPPH